MQSRLIGKTYILEELFNSNVLNTFEHIRKQVQDFSVDTINEYNYLNPEFDDYYYALAIERLFVDILFNEKYTLDYIKFLDRAKSIYEFEENLVFDGFIRGKKYNKSVKIIAIPPLLRYFDMTTRLHEFSHYLNYKKCPKLHYDFLNTEVHSIFMEHIVHDFCVNNDFFVTQDNTWYYHFDQMLSNLYTSQLDFETLIKENQINASYEDFLKKVLYYFGYIYANKLYSIYLDDGKKFLKRYLGIYFGSSLEDVLEYYGVNMQKYDTVEPTLKLIKDVKENMR